MRVGSSVFNRGVNRQLREGDLRPRVRLLRVRRRAPEDAAAPHLPRGEVLVEAREDIDWEGEDGEAAVVHGPDRASPAVGADVFDGLFTCQMSRERVGTREHRHHHGCTQTLTRMYMPQPAGSGGCTASA